MGLLKKKKKTLKQKLIKTYELEYKECRKLLDNLVRMVETRDETGMEQCSGAGREFLDTN